jgi:hypothetical protein
MSCLFQSLLSPACDDDFVAESVESFGKTAANAGTAARDENGISG